MEAEDVRLYFLRQGVEQVSQRSRTQMRETVEWIDETASAIHREKQWEPREGEGCRTCSFQSVCPQKTGKSRPRQGVWQQGDLLWEMAATERTEEVPRLPEEASIPADTPRQTEMDLFG